MNHILSLLAVVLRQLCLIRFGMFDSPTGELKTFVSLDCALSVFP